MVPHRGNFPLGLGVEMERSTLSVDDHVRLRQAELLDRLTAKSLSPSLSPLSVDAESFTIADYILETRQYDYKPRNAVNPLFHSIGEQDRRVILCQEVAAKGNRPRSDSQNNLSSGHVSESEINKELDVIRSSREQSGCNCKPMKVDKLSFGKIKSLLSARSSDIGLPADSVGTLTKSEACDWMRKLIKICPICVAGNCACITLEVECSAELCSCLRRVGSSGARCNRSDSVDSTDADGTVSTDINCGNNYGSIVFEPETVDEYRRRVFHSLSINADVEGKMKLESFEKLLIDKPFDIPCKP